MTFSKEYINTVAATANADANADAVKKGEITRQTAIDNLRCTLTQPLIQAAQIDPTWQPSINDIADDAGYSPNVNAETFREGLILAGVAAVKCGGQASAIAASLNQVLNHEVPVLQQAAQSAGQTLPIIPPITVSTLVGCNAGQIELPDGSCDNCPAGTQPDPRTGATCAACPIGQLNPVAGGTCSDCPPGKYCASTGLTAPTGTCSAPVGSLCPAGATTPTGSLCPAGNYCASAGLTAPTGTCPAYIQCPPGTGQLPPQDCRDAIKRSVQSFSTIYSGVMNTGYPGMYPNRKFIQSINGIDTAILLVGSKGENWKNIVPGRAYILPIPTAGASCTLVPNKPNSNYPTCSGVTTYSSKTEFGFTAINFASIANNNLLALVDSFSTVYITQLLSSGSTCTLGSNDTKCLTTTTISVPSKYLVGRINFATVDKTDVLVVQAGSKGLGTLFITPIPTLGSTCSLDITSTTLCTKTTILSGIPDLGYSTTEGGQPMWSNINIMSISGTDVVAFSVGETIAHVLQIPPFGSSCTLQTGQNIMACTRNDITQSSLLGATGQKFGNMSLVETTQRQNIVVTLGSVGSLYILPTSALGSSCAIGNTAQDTTCQDTTIIQGSINVGELAEVSAIDFATLGGSTIVGLTENIVSGSTLHMLPLPSSTCILNECTNLATLTQPATADKYFGSCGITFGQQTTSGLLYGTCDKGLYYFGRIADCVWN